MKELIDRHLGTAQDRTAAVTLASCAANAVLGAGKLAVGIGLFSMWFVANALYYLVLCAARRYALRKYTAARRITDGRARYAAELAVYKHSGLFICLLGLSYFLVCLRMYRSGDSTAYSGLVVYGVAFVSFTKLGFAIAGTISTRHLRDPILSTIKIISFIDAVVSIVVTQCALLTMQSSPYAVSSSALFGMGCSILFTGIGLSMRFVKPSPSFREKCADIIE